MSGLGIQLDLTKDAASPAVARLHAYVGSARLQETVGLSAQHTLRTHLLRLNGERSNALGGPRSNFYQRAGNSTTWAPQGDNAVLISIPHQGIAQRYYGGTIKAGKGTSSLTGRPTKYLTLPARAESYGKSPASFPDLVVLWGRKGPYALARAAQTAITISRPGKLGVRKVGSKGLRGGEVLFWLKKEITQQPDPTVLPTQDQVRGNIVRDVSAALDLEINRGGSN